MIISRNSRFRRYAKWIGFWTSLLILAVWAVSLWSYGWIAFGDRGFLVCSYQGLTFVNEKLHRDWRKRTPHFSTQRWQGFSFDAPKVREYGSLTEFQVPFWLPFLAAAIPTAILFYLDRRKIPPGHCTGCEYDLRGIESGICPECGKANTPIHTREK